MFAASRTILFRYLPPSRRQLQKTSVAAADLVLYPSEDSYTKDVMETFNAIINIVAKDTAPDTIRRLARLSKYATSSSRDVVEPLATYIERFLLPAQKYLSLVKADRKSSESQNLAMIPFSSASLLQQVFLRPRLA